MLRIFFKRISSETADYITCMQCFFDRSYFITNFTTAFQESEYFKNTEYWSLILILLYWNRTHKLYTLEYT